MNMNNTPCGSSVKTAVIQSRRSSGACPTFFRAHITQAATAPYGYAEAGRHLAMHAESLILGEVDDDVVGQLHDLAGRIPDDGWRDEVWQWFRATLPRCMALVPARRKETFLRGVEQAIEEGRI